MEKNTKRLMVLFSLILIVVPMVVFPSRMGLPLGGGSALNMLYETLFYGIVLFLFRRETTLPALIAGSALTLVYRLALGAVFGVMIIIMYALDASIAFSLGMSKYLPAVLLHALCAPFLMRPVYFGLVESMTHDQAEPEYQVKPRATMKTEDRPVAPAYPSRGFETASLPAALRSDGKAPMPLPGGEGNQFERAVAYLAEPTAVKMALVVSDEGLTLARFSRSDLAGEVWAPMAILLEDINRRVLVRAGWPEIPERVDISTRNLRVVLRRLDHATLMVLTDHTIDDTIHIRIAQAADMIRRYMNERYSPALFARAEGRYVSNS